MKLYHATQIDNKDNILLCSLVPGMHSNFDKWIKQEGIYGFAELKNAIGFAYDQSWNHGVIVFSFESNNIILDPEYDDPDYGIAYFVPTENSITDFKIEYEIEY